MASVSTVHTADLAPDDLRAVRALLDDAFEGELADADWEHTLGGLHVLVHEEDGLVAHAAVVQRRLLHRDASIRAGYVEALAVRGDRRRRGLASAAMDAVEGILRFAYDLGALSDGTGIENFYERRGWLRWHGPTYVMAPSGFLRTEGEDGGVLVFRTPSSPELDPSGPIVCDWRPGDVW